MDNIFKFMSVLLVLASILLSGCKTSERFEVKTLPNSAIILPYEDITSGFHTNQLGETTLVIPSDYYAGYVTVKDANYPLGIPMGLDIKGKKRPANVFGPVGFTTGMTIMGMGTLFTVVGACVDDSSFMLGGVGGIGAGAILAFSACPSFERMKQLSYMYRFTYKNNQNLDVPPLETTLRNPDQPKEIGKTVSKRRKAQSETEDVNPDTGVTKSKKTRGNSAKKVSGTYFGSGRLYFDNKVDDQYSEIEIIVKEIDKGHVEVIVVEGGEDFFDRPLKFEVKEEKGKFVFTNVSNSSISIILSKDGTLSFTHPRVMIDDEIYKLTCTAKRTK